MNPDDTDEARAELQALHGKTLTEAAQTYLLGVLEVDLPDDLREQWQTSFDSDAERREAEAALDRLSADEREALLRVAMEATVDDRPDTADLFTESVEQAGQSLFVLEAATVALAAALLIREWHARGRRRVKRRTETVDAEGNRKIETEEVEFATDPGLARLLGKLGLGSA
jgi:hypothetical protein